MRHSFFAVLVASAALGQTTIATVTFGVRETPSSTAETLTIGPSSCTETRSLFWIWNQLTPQPCGNLRLWATTSECGTEPKSGDVEYPSVPLTTVSLARSGSFDVDIDSLPGFAAGTTTPCGSTMGNVVHRICAAISTAFQCGGFGQTATTTVASPSFQIVYDVQAPSAPVLTEVVSRDKALRLYFTATSDTTSVVPLVRAKGQPDFIEQAEVTLGSSRELTIDGLQNNTTYELALRAKDAAGNVSVASELAEGTPVRTVGFWGLYQQSGGTDPGGCASVPGAAMLMGLLAWAQSRRRFR